MQQKIKQIIISVTLTTIILMVSMLLASNAQATEITPNPDSYSFGSTSEFSSSQTIVLASENTTEIDENLAETGDNATLLYILANLLVISGLITLWQLRHP